MAWKALSLPHPVFYHSCIFDADLFCRRVMANGCPSIRRYLVVAVCFLLVAELKIGKIKRFLLFYYFCKIEKYIYIYTPLYYIATDTIIIIFFNNMYIKRNYLLLVCRKGNWFLILIKIFLSCTKICTIKKKLHWKIIINSRLINSHFLKLSLINVVVGSYIE